MDASEGHMCWQELRPLSVPNDFKNPAFEKFMDQMYPVKLEIKYMTEINTSASYLDFLLSIGSCG